MENLQDKKKSNSFEQYLNDNGIELSDSDILSEKTDVNDEIKIISMEEITNATK